MVSSMSHCQPAVNKKKMASDHLKRQSMTKPSLTTLLPTHNRVVLKGHFGQGQLFYESANCKQNQRKSGKIFDLKSAKLLLLIKQPTCWSHKFSPKTSAKRKTRKKIKKVPVVTVSYISIFSQAHL